MNLSKSKQKKTPPKSNQKIVRWDTGLTSFEMSRSDFLRLSAAGFAAGALAGLPGCSGGSEKYKVISDAHASTITAFARRMIPDIEGSPISVNDIDVGAGLDYTLARQPEKNVKNTKLALNVLEYGPIIFSLKFSRFTRLAPEEQDKFVNSLSNSGSAIKRSIAYAVKSYSVISLYEDPRMPQMFGVEKLEFCK